MDKYALDGHKLYWHLDRVLSWQKDRLIAPIYIEISPVSYCNHNCVFCGLDFTHDRPLALDADMLKVRIVEMAELGVKSIMFAGEGEPLLHPRLPEIVRIAKESGIDLSITTNGMAGSRELWELLLPHLSWLRFSIDAASPDVYREVHQVPVGSFDLTIKSLKEALETRTRLSLPVTVGVQFLMIRENIDDIEKAIRLYSELGVDYLSLKPYSEHPQMLNKSGFTYSDKMIEQIDALVKKHRAPGKTEIYFRRAATIAYSGQMLNFAHCCALPFWGYVSSKGDFYTCSVYLNDDRFKAGNINVDAMADIFNGEKRKRSVSFAEQDLAIGHECRINCRMARVNEFLDYLNRKPEHINFI